MRVAVVDDDILYREEIIKLLAPYKNPHDMQIYQYGNGAEFVKAAMEAPDSKFDIVFMDIEMNGMNGIEAVKKLRDAGHDTIVFFITNHSTYVSDSFRLGAIQYLTKPVRKEQFDIDMARTIDIYRHRNSAFYGKWKGSEFTLYVRDIVYVEAMGHHVALHTYKGCNEYSGSMQSVYDYLKQFDFVKIHQGYIVNMDHIVKFTKTDIYLDNDVILPISRTESRNVNQIFHSYISRREKCSIVGR